MGCWIQDQGIEKVHDLVKSRKVTVDMLESLPIDIGSKSQIKEVISSGPISMEKVFEAINQENLRIFKLLVTIGALTGENCHISGDSTVQKL